jgi:hypothetical protein
MGKAESQARQEKVTNRPGKVCTICASPDLIALQKLITENVPLLDIVARFPAVKKSALSRHSINHMGRKGTGGHASRGSGIRPPKGPARKSHPADGRCSECGQIATESEDGRLEPQNLIRRAERMLWTSETVAARALDSDDSRLVLLALDRVKSALETLMKAHGMLGPDISVNIDNRQQNAFVGWSTEALQAFTELGALLDSGMPVREALHAILGAKESVPALPPGRNQESEALGAS